MEQDQAGAVWLLTDVWLLHDGILIAGNHLNAHRDIQEQRIRQRGQALGQKLRDFLRDAIHREKKHRQLTLTITKALETLRGYELPNGLVGLADKFAKFLAEGTSWPLKDILGLDAEWKQIAEKEWLLISRLPNIITSVERVVREVETYREKVCVKSGWFFRKAEYRMETKTGMVDKTILEKYSIGVERLEIRSLNGPVIAGMDFCRIPAGTFLIGNQENQHRVTLTKDFGILHITTKVVDTFCRDAGIPAYMYLAISALKCQQGNEGCPKGHNPYFPYAPSPSGESWGGGSKVKIMPVRSIQVTRLLCGKFGIWWSMVK